MSNCLPGYGDEQTWPPFNGDQSDPRTPEPRDVYAEAQAIAADSARLMALKADGDLVYAELQVKHNGGWLDLDRAHDVLRGHILAGRYADADVLARDIRDELVREIERLIGAGRIES